MARRRARARPRNANAPLESGAMHDSEIAFDERGLVPCIVQDYRSGEVLTLAYMNAESLRLTRETGEMHFFSRARQELWHKGATSGNTQALRAIRIDCDGDALLALVEPAGAGMPHRRAHVLLPGRVRAGRPRTRCCRHSSGRSPPARRSGRTAPTRRRCSPTRNRSAPKCRRRPRRSPGRPARNLTSACPRRRPTCCITSRCCSAAAGCRSQDAERVLDGRRRH